MADGRNDLLGELAADAALERTDFIISAADQLRRFLEANKERIAELGGLVLIDEEPDYLSVAPDGSFRSRTRYLDEATGQWVSETEVIDSPAELVELYNPADIYAEGLAELLDDHRARSRGYVVPIETWDEAMSRVVGCSLRGVVGPTVVMAGDTVDGGIGGMEGGPIVDEAMGDLKGLGHGGGA
jgi:hypothetical protein